MRARRRIVSARGGLAALVAVAVAGVAGLGAGCAPLPRSGAAWPGDDRVLVGHGQGATASEAHADALADLAAQVRAEVSARSERFAEASAEGGHVWASVRARRDIAMEARLAHAELARRRRIRHVETGNTEVTLTLDRAAWAARRRADAADEARLALGALDSLSAPPADPPAVRWHVLGRAVAAARAWQAAEREASTVGPPGPDTGRAIGQALSTLVSARDAAAHGTSCVVAIDGDETVAALAAAACGASATSSLLGPRASDGHTIALRGRVERRLARDDGLVFADCRLVLAIEGGGRVLETLVLGGLATRRGHLEAGRAAAASDMLLQAVVADALGSRFR